MTLHNCHDYQDARRLFINALQKKKSDFFFIQIGAADGFQYDPIYSFIRQYDCKGILIEPCPDLFPELQKNYQSCNNLIFENLAVAHHTGTQDFHYYPASCRNSQDFPSWAFALGSILPPFHSHAQKTMQRLGFPLKTERVACMTFSELLEKHRVKGYDFLQIDAEGFDGEILSAMSFEQGYPSFIQFEHKHIDLACRQGIVASGLAEVLAHLKDNGYSVHDTGNSFDTFCVHKSMLE